MKSISKKNLYAYILAAIIVVAVVIIDLVSKTVTDGVSNLYIFDNFLAIHSVYNYNAAFSNNFGLSAEVFFVVVTISGFVSLALMIFFLVWIKNKNKLFIVSIAMMMAGGLGNLIDRLAFGYVRDFIKVEYFGYELFGGYSFPVFNIADSSLIVGSGLMIIWLFVYYIREDSSSKDKKINDEQSDTLEVLVDDSTICQEVAEQCKQADSCHKDETE